MSDRMKQLAEQVMTAMQGYVARALAGVGEQVKALQVRIDSLPGRDELKGEKGDAGDRGERGEPGARGEDGRHGERGEPGERGEKGDAGDRGEKGDPGERGEPGERGKDGAPGERGEKGETGPDGRAGIDGKDGRDALELDIHPAIDPFKRYHAGTYASRAGGVWKAVRPTDPLPEDGDAFAAGWKCILCGVAEIALEQSDDMRTMGVAIRMSDGATVIKQFDLAGQIDRGVFKAGECYERGDGVTWDGSYWIAQRKTLADEKPGDSSGAFRMAVKKGRDGLKGDRGDRGAPGRDGKDQ